MQIIVGIHVRSDFSSFCIFLKKAKAFSYFFPKYFHVMIWDFFCGESNDSLVILTQRQSWKSFSNTIFVFWTPWLSCFLVINVQILGYGWAGMLRRYLVEPVEMWWPSNLAQVSLFRSDFLFFISFSSNNINVHVFTTCHQTFF